MIKEWIPLYFQNRCDKIKHVDFVRFSQKRTKKGRREMIGILVEKPSQARNFSAALGGMKGTYNGESYVIAPARGHLYGFIDKPEKMVPTAVASEYSSWDLKYLPWNEEDFDWRYVQKKDTKDALANIKATLGACDELVIGTDDDPTGEGELIAWEVFSELNLRAKKYSRMYFADESVKEIQKAFTNRKTLGTDLSCMYDDPDYKQALFRTKWDYLSIQWTRVATAFAPYPEVPRQGRLKSAIVRVVGDQLKAIAEYVEKPYYEPRFKDENGNTFSNPKIERYAQESDVPIGNYHASEVICDKVTRKSTAPRKFLDLASLGGLLASQGVTAKTVLSTYQKMYEDKVVSYPRTEDKCITIEQFNELLPLVDKIAGLIGVDTALLTHRTPRKTHVKTGMAHGANRPGPNVPASLDMLDNKYGQGAKLIYVTLARNYLATLCEDYEYDYQEGHLKDYPDFKGSASVPKVLGWKQVFGETDDDVDETSTGLGKNASPFVYRGVNPKPTHPTMKWLMKQLEKYDVGTGATRTSVYADVTSSTSKYPLLVEKKGKITMAPIGKTSYTLLPNTNIGSLDITERMQKEMKAIYDGKSDGQAFLHDVQRMILEDIETMRENGKSLPQGSKAPAKERYEGTWKGAPVKFVREWSGHRFTDDECARLCAGEKIEFEAISKKGTKYKAKGVLKNKVWQGHKYVGFEPEFSKIPASMLGHEFSEDEVKALEAGEEIFVKGMVSSKGNVFSAYLRYGKKADGKEGFEFRFNKR